GSGGSTGGGSTGGASGGGSGGAWGAKGPLVAPANTTGPKGTTILVGKAGKHQLDVYEDMRCPVCAAFEQGAGETLMKDVEDGKYQARIHMAAFLDDSPSIQGSGSKNALSALGAALDVSPDAFMAYKHALYSAANHPEETTDSFAKDDYLLKVAQEVPELKDNAAFAKDVTNGTYDPWAREVATAFLGSGKSGVPEIDLDGQVLTSSSGGPPMTAAEYRKAVDDHL
ncbi:thioredoxin domain-containing protein, partial [Streptomyces palmae]